MSISGRYQSHVLVQIHILNNEKQINVLLISLNKIITTNLAEKFQSEISYNCHSIPYKYDQHFLNNYFEYQFHKRVICIIRNSKCILGFIENYIR